MMTLLFTLLIILAVVLTVRIDYLNNKLNDVHDRLTKLEKDAVKIVFEKPKDWQTYKYLQIITNIYTNTMSETGVKYFAYYIPNHTPKLLYDLENQLKYINNPANIFYKKQ